MARRRGRAEFYIAKSAEEIKKMKVPLVWQPQEGPQTEFFKTKAFEVLFGGSKGGAKTESLVMGAARQVRNPHYRGLILRRKYPQLKDIIDRTHEYYPRLDPGAHYDKQDHRWRFSSGSAVDFGHCESEEDKRNYQGQEYHYMGFDQVEEFTQSQYEFIIMNCRSSRKDIRCEIKCTANPGGIGHAWCHKRWIDGKEPYKVYTESFALPNGQEVAWTRQFIPSRVWDNKILLERSPMYLAQLMSLPEDQRRAMLDGDWNVFEGQYFGEWRPVKNNEEYHVIAPFAIPSGWRRFRSMDWGFKDPSAVYWHAVSPEHGRIITYQELYENGLTASELAKKVSKLTPKEDYISYTVASPDIWAKRGNDSMHGESIAETMMKHDIRLTKADNNRINGWMRMREFMAEAPDGKPYWQVFSTCKNLIRTLPTLIYDDHDKEDVADGGEDHSSESCRYALMSRPRPNAMLQPEISGTYHPGELRMLGYSEAKIKSLVSRGLIKLIGKLGR